MLWSLNLKTMRQVRYIIVVIQSIKSWEEANVTTLSILFLADKHTDEEKR